MEEALRNAHRQSQNDGIVNITEYYEEGMDQPVNVGFGAHFQPDKKMSFADDSEEYLDMTAGPSKSNISNNPDADAWEDDRESYIQELIDTEQQLLDQEEQQSEQTVSTASSKDKRFGSGFARGFLGKSATKSEGRENRKMGQGETGGHDGDTSGNAQTATMEPIVLERRPEPSKERDADGADEEDEAVDAVAVKDVITERKPSRRRRENTRQKNRFRNNQGGNINKLVAMHSYVTEEIMEEDDEEDDDGDEGEGRERVSKFKQMREMQRGFMTS